MIDWELVCIPSILIVTTVGIDRTQHTVVNSYSEFVLESMTCKSSVVHLDINFEVFIQIMSFKESNNCLCIYIMLMLAWFHWFRFDKECTFKAFGTSIVATFGQHHSQMLFLTF